MAELGKKATEQLGQAVRTVESWRQGGTGPNRIRPPDTALRTVEVSTDSAATPGRLAFNPVALVHQMFVNNSTWDTVAPYFLAGGAMETNNVSVTEGTRGIMSPISYADSAAYVMLTAQSLALGRLDSVLASTDALGAVNVSVYAGAGGQEEPAAATATLGAASRWAWPIAASLNDNARVVMCVTFHGPASDWILVNSRECPTT